ncbi:hypothetical protein TorRG33x02_282060 [Trema orientale]|uniref:Membrane-associated kinase regulator n=1 Tax=Trema orientale TaxID=63057 RepID=A0A2P5CK27_TREOI|nr:hypothetical protein TorRG33x02_282060 [Trema orientale]
MAKRLQNKSSFDVAADASSLESLSFSGFLCIQDQKLKSPPTNSQQIHKQDLEFEFSQSKQESTTTDPSKYSPADLLISNDKILPQAFLLQSKQHPQMNKPRRKGSSPATFIDSERSSDRTGAKEESNKKKREQKEHSTSGSAFGWKLFKSFASPCRECKAATPTVKARTIPRESLKLY